MAATLGAVYESRAALAVASKPDRSGLTRIANRSLKTKWASRLQRTGPTVKFSLHRRMAVS